LKRGEEKWSKVDVITRNESQFFSPVNSRNFHVISSSFFFLLLATSPQLPLLLFFSNKLSIHLQEFAKMGGDSQDKVGLQEVEGDAVLLQKEIRQQQQQEHQEHQERPEEESTTTLSVEEEKKKQLLVEEEEEEDHLPDDNKGHSPTTSNIYTSHHSINFSDLDQVQDFHADALEKSTNDVTILRKVCDNVGAFYDETNGTGLGLGMTLFFFLLVLVFLPPSVLLPLLLALLFFH
jgi:hypothetical protein